jgi:hypothetical protein
MVYNFVLEIERSFPWLGILGDSPMSQLVQSACPGCKTVLRIPADWLPQAIRCKHCGMVLQAKSSASAARATPSQRTPPRKEQITAAPVAKAAPPTGITPAVAPAVPVAQPAAVAQPGSLFGDLREKEQQPARRRSRRAAKGGGWWKGPLVGMAALIVAVTAVWLSWDHLAALIPPDDEDAVVENTKNKDTESTPPPKTDMDKPSPVKPTGNKNPSSKKGPAKNPPPKKDPTKNPPPRKDPTKDPPPWPRPGGNLWPRRALIISVHDYLYANPIQNGTPGPQGTNFKSFIDDVSRGLHVPLNQIAHLSDDAGPKWGARAPTKTVIEQTLTNFLDSSRPQDRILVFFVGHAVEIGDDAYLAPIEGELDRAETLIPLKWVYEQLAKCKAKQKVLVLDGNRYHRTFGQERPGGEAMGEKLDATLKAPPAGVQVWSSCIAKQRSYASDDFPMGVFLESLQKALRQGGEGQIQKPEAALPLERYVDAVNKFMKDDLSKRKLEQVSRLSGKEADSGAAYDAKERPAPDAVASLASPPAGVEFNKKLVEVVLDQIGTPPVKVTHEMALRYDALPPFPVESLRKYQGDQPNPDSPLRKAVKNARAVLWAIYPGGEPEKLRTEVGTRRQDIGVQLTVLKDGYPAPGGGNAEKQFKDRVLKDEYKVALLIRAIEESLEELQSEAVKEARGKESPRWKANYDFILARMQLEYAYLFEYQSALGSMRKELPPINRELQDGWKLASKSDLQGDAKGKKSAREARKLLDKIIKDNAGTPWEVLAKREKLTNLGLEWQATRFR